VGRVADAVRVPIHGALNSLLDDVPSSEVELVLADPQFQFFAGLGDSNPQARIWFIERLLMDEIPRRKLALLRAERRAARTRPLSSLTAEAKPAWIAPFGNGLELRQA
jgi:hypothetical protein